MLRLVYLTPMWEHPIRDIAMLIPPPLLPPHALAQGHDGPAMMSLLLYPRPLVTTALADISVPASPVVTVAVGLGLLWKQVMRVERTSPLSSDVSQAFSTNSNQRRQADVSCLFTTMRLVVEHMVESIM